MFPTKNDIPKGDREKLVKLLNATLADCVDLQTQIKQAHWNVKGPNFIGLHKLFDEIYDDAVEYGDEIAERVVQLGGVALGTARIAAKASGLKEYPHDIADGTKHVEALSTALAAFGKTVRAASEKAGDIGDDDTADLYTGVSRGIDKWLWFVEAHQQAKS